MDDQNPNRANRYGKTKNMGSVGMTYQKVNDACSAIFASEACSMYIQTIESSVIRGSAAKRPPNFPLRLATSDISTTTPADIKYFVISHCITTLIRTRFCAAVFCDYRDDSIELSVINPSNANIDRVSS